MDTESKLELSVDQFKEVLHKCFKKNDNFSKIEAEMIEVLNKDGMIPYSSLTTLQDYYTYNFVTPMHNNHNPETHMFDPISGLPKKEPHLRHGKSQRTASQE